MGIWLIGAEDYKKLKLKDFVAAIGSYFDNEYEKEKSRWERTRILAITIMNTSYASKADKKRYIKNWKFPWDEDKFDNKEIKEFIEYAKKLHGDTF